jgi:hypothetical protein
MGVPQVVLDLQPPELHNLTLAVRPTADKPQFQLRLSFSEPVSWLADSMTIIPSTTTNSSSSSTSSSNDAPDVNDSSLLATADAAATAPTVATFSSNRLLLTNAVVLNISAVAGTTAVTQSGQATGAATEYTMWLQSWAGAQAAVQVMGAAYQDLAGNPGRNDSMIEVSSAHINPRSTCDHSYPLG